MVGPTERRKATRYELCLPAMFTWQGQAELVLHGDGFTRDVGATGVFIETRTRLPVGACVQIEICLPSLNSNTASRRVIGEGCVVRFEDAMADVGRRGFAAECKELRLQRG